MHDPKAEIIEAVVACDDLTLMPTWIPYPF